MTNKEIKIGDEVAIYGGVECHHITFEGFAIVQSAEGLGMDRFYVELEDGTTVQHFIMTDGQDCDPEDFVRRYNENADNQGGWDF